MARIDELRTKYRGRKGTLNGKPAVIHSIENGGASAVVSSRESGEEGGRFVLSRGHLAI